MTMYVMTVETLTGRMESTKVKGPL